MLRPGSKTEPLRSMSGAAGSAIELTIPDAFVQGTLSRFAGEHYASLAIYDAAQSEYLEAIAAFDRVLSLAADDVAAHNNRGNAFQGLGDLQSVLSQHGPAESSYEAAIAAFDRALEIAPDEAALHNNRGIALEGLGDLQSRMSRHGEAAASCIAAATAFDRALQIAPTTPRSTAIAASYWCDWVIYNCGCRGTMRRKSATSVPSRRSTAH